MNASRIILCDGDRGHSIAFTNVDDQNKQDNNERGRGRGEKREAYPIVNSWWVTFTVLAPEDRKVAAVPLGTKK